MFDLVIFFIWYALNISEEGGGGLLALSPSPPRDFFRIFPDLAGFGPRDPFQRVRGTRGINFAVRNVPKGRIWTPLRPGIPATSGGQSLYTTPPLSLTFRLGSRIQGTEI